MEAQTHRALRCEFDGREILAVLEPASPGTWIAESLGTPRPGAQFRLAGRNLALDSVMLAADKNLAEYARGKNVQASIGRDALGDLILGVDYTHESIVLFDRSSGVEQLRWLQEGGAGRVQSLSFQAQGGADDYLSMPAKLFGKSVRLSPQILNTPSVFTSLSQADLPPEKEPLWRTIRTFVDSPRLSQVHVFAQENDLGGLAMGPLFASIPTERNALAQYSGISLRALGSRRLLWDAKQGRATYVSTESPAARLLPALSAEFFRVPMYVDEGRIRLGRVALSLGVNLERLTGREVVFIGKLSGTDIVAELNRAPEDQSKMALQLAEEIKGGTVLKIQDGPSRLFEIEITPLVKSD